ncbi:MAG TPA: TIGR03619 family F420-dependent LLM class oxidoreductase [Stellaceae bacterium]|nr:TIGR03619 family F420-dependent LLM class oxidoreductase [Stellaceae bacterium]
MEIGAAIFFTDYSITPTKLAVALEERGFDSLWVAEHSHIPVSRRFSHPQGEAALTKEYFDVMDPFVTLSAAAAVTARLKLGTAVCLVIQRDTIQTAKLVASLDQVSKGRFLLGIGCGWNAEEMEDHGTAYGTRTLKMREQIEAMKQIWTKNVAEYHGQIVDFPPMNSPSRCRSRTHRSSSAAPSASPRGGRSATATGYYRQRRARVPVAQKSSCRAGARWPKRPAGTRARCR